MSALAAVTALVVLALVLVTGGPSATRRASTPATTGASTSTAIPAVEAGLLPWTLDRALSREVALPGPGTSVVVAGGLDAGQRSVSRIFSLDTATGATGDLGSLAAGVHDAVGAQVAGVDLVLGGGSPTTIADVERFAAPSPGRSSAGAVTARLPQPRSDSSAVTIGSTAYLVGGYDGANPDTQVLATADGKQFSVVAALPRPVRYAAVAALGQRIYVFGGEAVGGATAGGAGSGQMLDAVQMVDPATKSARVIGRLPHPLAGAAAVVVGGRLYLAGGAEPASAATAAPGTPTGATAGTSAGQPSASATTDVFAFDPVTDKFLRAGSLPEPFAYGAAVVVGNRAWLVGGERSGTPVSSVEMLTPDKEFGTAGAPGAGSPFFGAKLLVADRGNDRLLLLDDTDRIIWTYPSDYAAAPPGGFYFPDDAFFARKGTEIISNQEQNETIVVIAFPSGQVLWQYGHPRQPGTAPGYLHEPDDAYLLKNGQITVADAQACRVLFLNPDKTVAQQIGTNDVCKHQPAGYLGSPNGDTPLADGNVLVSEINGQWVSEYTPKGQLAWTVHLPVGYPSDPQQLGPDLYLLADYSHPGAIVEFNREGEVLYRYGPTSGLGELDKPSLTELLPSGVFMTNDDYRHRMVAVDPATQALVWQYGVPDTPGTAPGMLNIPDGFDLLLPDGSTPTHPTTG